MRSRCMFPGGVVDRFFGSGLLTFLRDLGQKNPGTLGHACEFLRANAKPGDVLLAKCWLGTALFLYAPAPGAENSFRLSDLRCSATPGPAGICFWRRSCALWLMWRFAWNGYLGYDLPTVAKQIQAQGGRLTEVATFKESRWENRESIHFRRFSGERYLFPWSKGYEPASSFALIGPTKVKVDLRTPVCSRPGPILF